MLLFVDFEVPNRLRIQGRAELLTTGPELAAYPGAQLVVKVVPATSFGDGSRRRLISDLRGRVGPGMKISVEEVDRIPREPNGKFRAVKSSLEGMQV